VLVDEDGSVLGRFNLYDINDGTAELGYRVAQHVAGRGVTTATVRELCRLASARVGLRELRAATARENVASQKVLTKAGFVRSAPPAPPTSAVSQARCISATWPPGDLGQGRWRREAAACRGRGSCRRPRPAGL